MRRAPSLKRRVSTGFVATAVVLVGVLGATTWWLHQAGRDMELRIGEDQAIETRISRFQASVLRELESGHRYLSTEDPAHSREFQRLGFETFALQQEILFTSGGNPEIAGALASVQRHLGVTQSVLARAHRLAELGRAEEAQQALERNAHGTDSILAGLERLEGVRSMQREAAVRRLTEKARGRGLLAVVLLAAGFIVAFVVSRGTVRAVVESGQTLTEHADRLQNGDLNVRTDVDALPEELRTLGEGLNDASRSLSELDEKEKALRRAEKLSTVGLLVSGVAHELNNPLAAILLTSEELAENDDRRAVDLGIETIRTQAGRARSIVRKLLLTVREDPDPRGSVAYADAEALARPALERLGAEAGVELLWSADPDLPRVRGDRAGLETVLTSLVTNAIEATPPGGKVRIVASSGGGGVRLEVEDDGPGIGPEIRSRIFDPFFTTKAQGQGIGLGLSVASGVVRSMGGSLEHMNVTPGNGGGAKFVVTFSSPGPRRAIPSEPGQATDDEPHRIPSAGGPAGREMRILIVDDEEPIRSTLRRVFERRGWRVHEAANGQEALDRIRNSGPEASYHVVLSDLKMPEMSGMELVDHLFTDDPEIGARFVIMTGDNVAPASADFVERTTLPVVDKPFELEELLRIVDRVAAGTEV